MMLVRLQHNRTVLLYVALSLCIFTYIFHSFWTSRMLSNELLRRQLESLPVELEDPVWTWISRQQEFDALVSSTVFYDDRRTDSDYLRLHWIYSVNAPKTFWSQLRFVIYQIDQSTQKETEIVIEHHEILGELSLARTIQGKSYRQFMMSFPVTSQIADNVVVFVPGFSAENHSLSVQRASSDNPVSFSVCVKPMFGSLPDNYIPRLVEWFQINILLGISEFHFYNASMRATPYFTRVLSHYGDRVIIHQFGAGFVGPSESGGLAVQHSDESEAAEIVTRAALSHCIYSNYKRTDYLLLIDIDEMVIPRTHSSYSSLFNSLNLPQSPHEQPASIAFVMAMFYVVYGEDQSQPDYLHTLKYRSRIIYNSGDLHNLAGRAKRTKSFINPKTCILAFHHYCLEMTSDSSKRLKVVPQSLAILHHYRDKFKWVKDTIKENPSIDDVMLRFKPYLENSVPEVLTKIKYRL